LGGRESVGSTSANVLVARVSAVVPVTRATH
jgi:hypothetical protein